MTIALKQLNRALVKHHTLGPGMDMFYIIAYK